MAKARTTLTMSIKVKLPVGVNAQDMMQFIRTRLTFKQSPELVPHNDNITANLVEKLQDALASDDTKVSLLQKVTEYK